MFITLFDLLLLRFFALVRCVFRFNFSYFFSSKILFLKVFAIHSYGDDDENVLHRYPRNKYNQISIVNAFVVTLHSDRVCWAFECSRPNAERREYNAHILRNLTVNIFHG